jgi:hypothetical protein
MPFVSDQVALICGTRNSYGDDLRLAHVRHYRPLRITGLNNLIGVCFVLFEVEVGLRSELLARGCRVVAERCARASRWGRAGRGG